MQRLMHIWAQVEQKLVNPAVMRQPFEAAGTRRIDALDLQRPVPVAAQATVPPSVQKPISSTAPPNLSRQNWSMFNPLSTMPISLLEASPMCELCAQTTAEVAPGPPLNIGARISQLFNLKKRLA